MDESGGCLLPTAMAFFAAGISPRDLPPASQSTAGAGRRRRRRPGANRRRGLALLAVRDTRSLLGCVSPAYDRVWPSPDAHRHVVDRGGAAWMGGGANGEDGVGDAPD